MPNKNKNPLKLEIEQSVQERIDQFKANESAARMISSDMIQQQLALDKLCVAEELEKMENIFDEVMPYIIKVREHFSNILDQNKFTASYFLFGKISQTWKALFLVAGKGFHYETMEFLRSIRETGDLVFLFMGSDELDADMKNWFETGKIISNEKARKAMHNFINKQTKKDGIELPLEAMKAGVYGGLSRYTHVSYGALLDSFNVFSRDFDFDRIAGFHHIRKSSLRYAYGEMNGFIITLKYFFQSVGDDESAKKLDLILRRIAPEMYDMDRNTELAREAIEKYS